MPTILVVDDEAHIRTHLATYLRSEQYTVELAASAIETLALLDRGPVDVVLSDVRMPGMSGLELLHEIRRRHGDAVVVLMTAYATVPDAVEAMRAGAYDYLTKPFALDEVGRVIARSVELRHLRAENRVLRRAVDDPGWLDPGSPAMARVLATARQVAPSDVTVLLTGESGTGKNVLARGIHRWSGRHAAPFVTIACTTLAEHLLESELCGHERGAFTGAVQRKRGRLEAAANGTVFLDEIGELALELQAKLLRFLEERRFERVGGDETLAVDVRIVAATNRDLEQEVAAGRFRRDLFFRLNVIALTLPPLRERQADLPHLIEYLLDGLRARHRRPELQLADDVRGALAAYDWPGNLRELANVLERAVVLSPQAIVTTEALPDHILRPRVPSPRPAGEAVTLRTLERRHIESVLSESTTLEEAAARLGIDVTTLWRKRKRWGL